MKLPKFLAPIGFVLLAAPSSRAQVTQRVSVGSDGLQANGDCVGQNDSPPSCSADGRFVVFASWASNLVANDTNGVHDVFVRNRRTGSLERVSLASDGTQGDQDSDYPSISADGRFIAFESFATNFVAGDTNQEADIFVHDRVTGVTARMSVDSNGGEGNGTSFFPWISGDGRFVVFCSTSWNLVPNDTNAQLDVFVHDRISGTTELISQSSSGVAGNDQSAASSISFDGRYVAFESGADNLVAGDTNQVWDIFVRDRRTATTTRVSVDSNGVQGNHPSFVLPTISASGRYVAFRSEASNLVPGDTNGAPDCFVHDRETGTTERVSVSSSGAQGNAASATAFISGDRYVVLGSSASNLVTGDTNGAADVFVRDLRLGTTERVSVGPSNAQGNNGSGLPFITEDGRFVVFVGWAANLVPGDTNAMADVFVRDRAGGTDFERVCAPGLDMIPCPCGNPPSETGGGCDNSSGTGGCWISASGATSLSSDSLVLEFGNGTPNALGMLLQGSSLVARGCVYGQGVRCVGPTIVRLYAKRAVSKSLHVPDFAAGDAPISVRSRAMGAAIDPGDRRWYQLVYRDPVVLGACPATSTFNVSGAGLVTWAP